MDDSSAQQPAAQTLDQASRTLLHSSRIGDKESGESTTCDEAKLQTADMGGVQPLRAKVSDAGSENRARSRPIRFCVSWSTGLEAVALEAEATVQELQDAVLSAPDVPAAHKHFVYKGQLLEGTLRVGDVPLHDGAVVHMLLRESESAGRLVHIKSVVTRQTRSVRCRADATVEEVKELLASCPGERPAEEVRLLFAGRELEDEHTLREYNIQKPCAMVAVARSASPRELEAFVAGVFPGRWAAGVAPESVVSVRFTSEAQDQSSYWGRTLGSPDLSTITACELRLLDAEGRPAAGQVAHDQGSRIVTLTPARPLQPASHYRVELNAGPFHRRECLFDPPDSPDAASRSPALGGPLTTGVFHGRVQERVEGSVCWDFFTSGYVPIRLVSVLPRPHCAVSPEHACVMLGFSGPLPSPSPALHMREWVRVPGHPLKAPTYDSATLSLTFEFVDPPPPGSVCRVQLQPELVRGARGESLLPLQADDLLKTSSFRWRFFVEPAPPYQADNAAASGLSAVWKRWRGGKLSAPLRARRRGAQVAAMATGASAAHSPQPSPPSDSPPSAVPAHMVYKPPSASPGELTGGNDPEPLEQPEPSPRPRVWAPGSQADEAQDHDDARAGPSAEQPADAPFVRPGYPIGLQVAVSPIIDLWQGAKQLLW